MQTISPQPQVSADFVFSLAMLFLFSKAASSLYTSAKPVANIRWLIMSSWCCFPSDEERTVENNFIVTIRKIPQLELKLKCTLSAVASEKNKKTPYVSIVQSCIKINHISMLF